RAIAMFLSVVILGRFTTETHAMALYIGTDTPHTHLHHVTGRNHHHRTKQQIFWPPGELRGPSFEEYMSDELDRPPSYKRGRETRYSIGCFALGRHGVRYSAGDRAKGEEAYSGTHRPARYHQRGRCYCDGRPVDQRGCAVIRHPYQAEHAQRRDCDHGNTDCMQRPIGR
ncbi:hypothetical protein KQR54_33380, partial [Mycobacterium gordonae]|nr:hypothetical protein [Mycobacterium gordonae]